MVALQTKEFCLNFSHILHDFWLIASRSWISKVTIGGRELCLKVGQEKPLTRNITFWLKFKRNAFTSVSTYTYIYNVYIMFSIFLSIIYLNPSSSRSSSSSRSGSRSRSPEARIPSKRKKKKTKKRGKSSKYYDDGDDEHHRHKGSRTSSRGSSYWEGKRRSRSPISSSSRSSSQSRSPSPNINHGARIRLEDQTSPDPNRTLNEKTVEQLEEEKRKLMKDLEAMKGTGSHSL